MVDQAARFLLDTLFGLLTYAFLLRFAMQLAARAVPQSARAGADGRADRLGW